MTSNNFLKKLERLFENTWRYEDKALHTEVLKVVPVTLLECRAQERLRAIQLQVKRKSIPDLEISIQDLLLLEVLAWFKDQFFKWVDNPICTYCGGNTKLFSNSNNVEEHKCAACGLLTMFIRHRDPGEAFRARHGRCGEWAAAFTLICRALKWPARFVLAINADHVWTEVWSFTQNRWLHCDPCETLCDTPLVYETGWGRTLDYVIAVSYEDIQDVTWRYVSDHRSTLQRRKECPEKDLVNCLLRLRHNRLQQFTNARRLYLIRRTLLELIELMIEKKPTDADKQGRTSGSLSWRLLRGETEVKTGFIWSASPADLTAGHMVVRYSTVRDIYQKISKGEVVETVQHWTRGVFSATGVFRKEEKDWKTAYLCREESVAEGVVTWRFAVGATNKRFDKVSLRCNTRIFENGQVLLHVNGDGLQIDLSSTTAWELDAVKGAREFTLSATLIGGRGDCAWQHAQLFRQSFDDNNFPFCISITFQ